MTSLFYRLYPKDAAIPDHTVTPAARWAKILANGGTLPEKEDDGNQTQEEPTASAMSGAMAGLAVLEETGKKRKAEELTELTTSDAGK
mmetsp:Transcript_75294/g.166350  ORF Transcript_75294/g.166350 Transcript_75294/m.166350 type:complete len:88 (+) Transcript_75294:67-330(+)